MAVQQVCVIIDGREIYVPKNMLVVEAAKRAGVEIPIFCYHPKLKPVGACRMCLVDIEKMPRLQTACTTPVSEGMIVHTVNDKARAAQKGVLEFLLANHPLDCPICDKGGECPLQDNTFKFGLGVSRFQEPKRRLDKAVPLSERIVLDRERCIMCYRCVRFQDEIAGDQALSAIDRAGTSQIGVLEGETFDSPFSGNTIDICPVGALLSRQYRFRARPWDLQRIPSVCTGCAVGCNTILDVRDRAIQRMVPRENMAINNEWLCDFGRFDTLPIGAERIRTPSLEGQAVPLEQAVTQAAELLKSGPVEIVASPSLTNEALNAIRGIAAGLNAPLGVWPAGAGRVRGAIADLVRSKTIILLNFDVWRELPVLALRIREALRAGGKLYFVGSGPNGLGRDTTATYASVDELLRGIESPQLESPNASGSSAGEAPTLPGPVSILGSGAEELGQRLEATGMVGEPATAANGWSAADLPAARFAAPVLLLAGNETWPELSGKQTISLRWSLPHSERSREFAAGADGATGARGHKASGSPGLGAASIVHGETGVDRLVAIGTASGDPRSGAWSEPATRIPAEGLVLPIAHPYEQTGSVTNLEGTVQELRPGGNPPRGARADWQVLTDLARALGLMPRGEEERATAVG